MDGAGFARCLAGAAERIGARMVLPGTEAALLALAEHRSLFPERVAVGAPDEQKVLRACDKNRLDSIVTAVGLTVPPTTRVALDDVNEVDVTFPAVVKPLQSEMRRDGRLERFEVVRVADRGGLVGALRDLPGQVGLVQPYLAGALRTVNGVAWDGEVVISVHKRATRTWPRDCGVVSYAHTIEPDAALDAGVRRLVAELGWSGLFNLQLIESDSGLHVIDLNPRVYHSLALAVAAGANLPAIWADLLRGAKPLVQGYRTGSIFRAEDDIYAVVAGAISDRRPGQLAALRPRPSTTHAVFDVRDPRPTRALVSRVAKGVARKLTERTGGRPETSADADLRFPEPKPGGQ
ncbi:ATP-grasp domain-containing protein [Pseudonocardia sp. N23]|uniref:ATP-grasp domain-containing protein n=1 Tax=Pseudonocardia sp. N23 TaxID=1987376 RepID=UPI001145C781|nr:ATP-grasp domain-containing protein [Pseudonocardia sp. N23]